MLIYLDYSCGLLNLISHFEKSNGRMRSLEASLHTATTTIKTLESSLQTEMSKTQFLVKELNETVHKETDRAIKAENVIARRVLSEKSRVDTVQKNLTDLMSTSIEQIKELEISLKQLERPMPSEKDATTPYHPAMVLMPQAQQPQSSVSEHDIQQIEVKLTSLQQFIQDLSNRIVHIEDGSEEHVNKGITQIFKTYASLANEIEKETERATVEESTLKTLITNEIAALGKQITTLQDRVVDEKNRVQVIENRRTADLFEEINRAKSEETRIAQKLKDEMSKAAAAFKRLEQHVDTKLNSSKSIEDDIKLFSENATKIIFETEVKLIDQINLERSRALSVETTLKTHLDAEMQRAMNVENELRVLNHDEKDRALSAEKDLKSAIDVETYRAKGVEFSISGQITQEMERSKQEEQQIHEHINANMTRLLTDIIKEFTRAQNAEMELAEKIKEENSRAISVERGLLVHVNTETTRATEKEQDLLFLIKSQENSTRVVDQCRNLIDAEYSRARGFESKLENQIFEEVARAKNKEENLLIFLNEELTKSKSIEVNITQTSQEILRSTRELELEVRKTVMAEVARAVDSENSIKAQLYTEVDRARGAELALSHGQAGNYSDISGKMQEMIREIEKDNLRLEDISLQISRNLTGDILTLAELFDDKLDDLERSENIRLKKIEDDMKKCCSGSSWRWRSQKGKSAGSSAAGAVINKIMQVFGGSNEDDNQDGVSVAPIASPKKIPGKTNTRNKGGSSKGRSMDSSPEDDSENSDDPPVTQVVPVVKGPGLSQYHNRSSIAHASKASNETVVYVLSSKVVENVEELELPEKIKVPRKMPLRGSRRINGLSNINMNSNNDSSISVHSVNSKVTSTFG